MVNAKIPFHHGKRSVTPWYAAIYHGKMGYIFIRDLQTL
jgi:hypothetical protein